MFEMEIKKQKVILLISRIFIGLIFIISGISKMINLNHFIDTVHLFQILPLGAIIPFSSILGPMELALGIAFAIGWNVRISSLILLSLLIIFITAIIPQLLSSSPPSDCGCFSLFVKHRVDSSLLIIEIIIFIFIFIIFHSENEAHFKVTR